MIDYSLVLTVNYPNTQWAFDNIFDYATLAWHDTSVKPTQAELDALWESTQATVAAKIQNAIYTKASALAKLAALGLSEDEVKALVG